MNDNFEQLKEHRKADFNELRHSIRFNVKTHRKTKLKQAGCSNAKHSNRLFNEYIRLFNDQRQLRYLTLLHEVTELETDTVLRSCDEMRTALIEQCKENKVRALGVIEIELVNLTLLKRIDAQTDVEKRKLRVLTDLILPSEHGGLRISHAEGTKALVHAHVVLQLKGNPQAHAHEFENSLKSLAAYRRAGHQVRIEEFFKTKDLRSNLEGIAKYGTKGGNEQLRYKAGFGRDLSEDLDAKIFKATKTGKRDKGGETLEDERSLTIGELAFLNEVYEQLMSQRRDRRGYLIRA
jgi:hypothetical protein